MSNIDSFEKAMTAGGVTKLGDCEKFVQNTPKPKPDNTNTIAGINEVLTESITRDPETSRHQIDSGDELRKSGLKNLDFNRLKKGNFHREDSLFVRGYTVKESTKLIQEFLSQSVQSGFRCVKIIHGKGLNSPDGISKVRINTQNLLTQNQFVLGYCKALPNDGGSGAKYVLLKRRRY